jgi:NTE family protein
MIGYRTCGRQTSRSAPAYIIGRRGRLPGTGKTEGQYWNPNSEELGYPIPFRGGIVAENIKEGDKIMEEEKEVKREGIGLCLSGGGYRAAIFHMGGLRRLFETGILQQVRTISSVSGGTIIAAFMATQLKKHNLNSFQDIPLDSWDKIIAKPFRKIVSRDIRTWPLVKNWLLPWNLFLPYVRAQTLEKTYRKILTKLRLSELPETPDFVMCSTDIVFAVNWEFTRLSVGSYQSGNVDPFPDWHVSFAVAASSCFPPVFDPLRLPEKNVKYKNGAASKEKNYNTLIKDMRLTDGGVYDNLGLEPVWKDHETVIVSDGGAPFKFRNAGSSLNRVKRVLDVIGTQKGKLRKRWLISSLIDKDYKGTYWGIETSNEGKEFKGYTREFTEDILAKVRTDLDRFTEPEISVLENHGYMLSCRRLEKYCKDFYKSDVPSINWPNPDWQDEKKAREAMKDSSKRFVLKRMLGLM